MTRKIFLLLVTLLHTCNLFAQATIDVVEKTIKIPGLNEEVLYYGFATGDKIIFNFEEVDGKELKEIEITELPSSSKFADFKTAKIENKTLTIGNNSIYKFRFANTSLSGRVCKIKIQRIPLSEKSTNFNTNVYWRTIYDTTYSITKEKYLIKREYRPERLVKEKHYINSGSNATFKGGKSRITINVPLPQNTVKWYYVFSASRDGHEIEQTHSSMNLLGEISTILDKTGTANFGVQMLTQPPGGNVCDVYLLSQDDAALFEQKVAHRYFQDYSRENITSGIVQVALIDPPNLYLGIKNPDDIYGIHVSIEIVAITLNEQWGIRDVKHPNVTSRNEAYLSN